VTNRILRAAARRTIPSGIRVRLRQRGLAAWPPRGTIRYGTLQRTTPISSAYGFDRGTPVDRYYIAEFLRGHAADVRGLVLEVGDDRYTRMLGTESVQRVDILNLTASGARNEIVDDLARPQRLVNETYDCVICAQTLHLIYDMRSAVDTLRRLLRPEGVLLMTLPGISRISSDEAQGWQDYWRFTCASAARVLRDAFEEGHVEVRGYGNVLASISFLHGVAAEELRGEELDFRDDAYDLLVGVRAERSRDQRPV